MDEHEPPPDPWPLRNLVIRTPRLDLRPDDDAGLLELIEEVHHGVHPPEHMPFVAEWTDAPRERIGRNTLQHHWNQRAALSPEQWRINFLARVGGRVIGTQQVSASAFPICREIASGSWVGMRHQGNGYGTEMRAAMLMFAFDHLGADRARSEAFADNTVSRRVSAKLGYAEDGSFRRVRRGRLAESVGFLVTATDFHAHRPDWSIEVEGLGPCRALLGIDA